MRARYALYHAPAPGSALFELGRRWLGRDVATGEILAPPDPHRRSASNSGLHATLKPPMTLAAGVTEADLLARAEAFAETWAPVPCPPLVLADLDGFLALVPSHPGAPVQRLCDAVVRAFEGLRAPLDADEIARRRKSRLTARQDALLLRWGYPYVFDEFRLHYTLTDRLPADARARVLPELEAQVAGVVGRPFALDGLAVFAQDTREDDFTQIARFPFKAG